MYAYRDADGFLFEPIVIKKIFCPIAAGWDGTQERSHHFFGIDEEMVGSFFGAGRSVAGADFSQALGTGLACGNLRSEVAFAFFRRANIVEEKCEYVGNNFSATHDFDRRD